MGSEPNRVPNRSLADENNKSARPSENAPVAYSVDYQNGELVKLVETLTPTGYSGLWHVLGYFDSDVRGGVVEQAQDSAQCGVEDFSDGGHYLVVPHPVDYRMLNKKRHRLYNTECTHTHHQASSYPANRISQNVRDPQRVS